MKSFFKLFTKSGPEEISKKLINLLHSLTENEDWNTKPKLTPDNQTSIKELKQIFINIEKLVDQLPNLDQIILVNGEKYTIFNYLLHKIDLFYALRFDDYINDAEKRPPEYKTEEALEKYNNYKKSVALIEAFKNEMQPFFLSLIRKGASKVRKTEKGDVSPFLAVMDIHNSEDKTRITSDKISPFRSKIIKTLINEFEIDITKPFDICELTLLELASVYGDNETLKMLLSMHPKISEIQKNKLLSLTAKFCPNGLLGFRYNGTLQSIGFIKVLITLLKHGASPQTLLSNGMTVAAFLFNSLNYLRIPSDQGYEFARRQERLRLNIFSENCNHTSKDLIQKTYCELFHIIMTAPDLDKSVDSIFPFVKSIIDLDSPIDKQHLINRIFVTEKIIHEALSLQKDLFKHPHYKIQLLISILNSTRDQTIYAPYLKELDLSGSSIDDLMELYIVAIRRSKVSIAEYIQKQIPSIFDRLNEDQRLEVFKAALDTKNYTVAEAILKCSLNFNQALIYLFMPISNNDEYHSKEIQKYFISILIKQGATIFCNQKTYKVIQLKNAPYKKLIEKSSQELIYEFLDNNFDDEFDLLYRRNPTFNAIAITSFFSANKIFIPCKESKTYAKLTKYDINSPNLMQQLSYVDTALQIIYAYSNAIHAIELNKEIGNIRYIQLYDTGLATDTDLTNQYDGSLTNKLKFFFINLPKPIPKKASKLAAQFTSEEVKLSPNFDYLNKLFIDGWKFLRLQGRTIILQNEDKQLALKIQKRNEPPCELIKEYKVTSYLKSHAKILKLQTKLPTAIDVVNVVDILPFVKKNVSEEEYINFEKMVIPNSCTHVAYIYRVNKEEQSYFTYLHQDTLPQKNYNHARITAITDLCSLLSEGVIFPQLADMFHNSEHDRRFNPLINIFGNEGITNQPGVGRLSAWMEAVRYPNVRGTGLADLGDGTPISDLLPGGKFTTKYYNECKTEKIQNYLLANILAEYQYVFFLIAGRRAHDLDSKTIDDKEKIWQQTAYDVLNNAAIMLSKLSHLLYYQAYQFLLKMIDINLLARQMQFWMTNQYIPYILKNKIPDNIYPGAVVDIDFAALRINTFSKKIGFSINNKDQDLGPVNGPQPITEFDKLIKVMLLGILGSYNFHEKTKTNILEARKGKKADFAFFTKLPEYDKQKKLFIHSAVKAAKLEKKGLHKASEAYLLKAKKYRAEMSIAIAKRAATFWRAKLDGKNLEINTDKKTEPRA